MTPPTTSPDATLPEIRRAWQALQQGQFRTTPPVGTTLLRRAVQDPLGEDPDRGSIVASVPLVVVVGASGGCGATTTALAIATVAAAPEGCSATVVECASAAESGLVSACTAELGEIDGWRYGRRERVTIWRVGDTVAALDQVPRPPLPASVDGLGVTVLDIGWDVSQVVAAPGHWVGRQLARAHAVVVVAEATVPSLRRLESTLSRLPNRLADNQRVVAVLGPRPRRWPRHLIAAAGPLTTAAIQDNRLIGLPFVGELHSRGLDGSPLPKPLLAAASDIADRLRLSSLHPVTTSMKGHST